MRILINTELLPPDPRWAWDPKNPVTGTTKFYVRVAEELAKQGHNVFVTMDREGALIHNKVYYRSRDWARNLPSPDLVLDCNVTTDVKAPVRFQWTSLFGRWECVGNGYSRLFLVTEYVRSVYAHRALCPTVALELGCDMPVLGSDEIFLDKRPKICCYTSSPDRGGNFLAEIWPDVEKATGYKLQMAPYDAKFSNAELRALLMRSRFWLYPALGLDSIVSTLEAQACGCVPVFVPHMGLPETARYGVKADSVWEFPDRLIRTLQAFDANPEVASLIMKEGRETALKEKPIPTWADVVAQILAEYEAVREVG